MTVVIPYKQQGEGIELRYAIRSLVKHFKDMTGLIVIGDRPTWYTGDHIPCEDINGRKEFSIYSKLMKVQDTVLYSNDDFFCLQDFGTNLPNYYSGTCRQRASLVKDKSYKNLYLNCLPEWLNFDIHSPMIIDTTKFVWDIDRPIKTYYGNQRGLTGTVLADCKITGDRLYSEMKGIIKHRPVFSTKDNGDKPGVRKLLQELYPNPPVYERN